MDEDQDSLIENNLFAYCLNNPVKHIDSNGKLAITITAVALATVALAAVGAFAVGVVAVSSPNFRKALNQMCANLVNSVKQKLKFVRVAVVGISVYLSKGGKQNIKDTGLAGTSDAEISRRIKDPRTSKSEKQRLKKKQKARQQRHSSQKNKSSKKKR